MRGARGDRLTEKGKGCLYVRGAEKGGGRGNDEGIVREGRPAAAAVAAGAPLRVTLEGAHRRTLA